MLLTIGMIVKNEEKYLEQCLTALKPILENVDSELIIADTGSTDNTVEIAKKFTDNVFHFEWINDFSAARNSTLDKAKGEWYMFIDADEVIKDCAPLIDFFNSGEYKNYGSATYIQRNYNDLANMDLYSDYRPHRLSALKDGVRFAKPIHENFNQYFRPVKALDVVADHYGYVIKDNGKPVDLLQQKTQRNLDLLFKELEEGEKNGNLKENVYGQIADCYMMRDDCEEALKYIDMGLQKSNPSGYGIISYQTRKIKVLNKLGRHQEVIEMCERYFSKDNLARKGKLVTDNSVYFFWASASYTLEDYQNAVNKAALGFDIYRNYVNGKFFTDELYFVSVETTIPMLKQICNLFILACDKTGRYNDAVSQLPNMPLKDFMRDKEFMRSHLAVRNILMEKTNYNKLPDLYFQLDAPNRETYINILIRNVFTTSQLEHFLKKLSLIASDNERLADIVEIFNSYFIRHDLTPAKTTAFIEKHGTKDNEVIWILMMKKHFDVMPFILADDFDPGETVDRIYLDVVQADYALDLFADMIYRLPENGVEKAVEVFENVVLGATKNNFDTTKAIRSFVQLGKRWEELNPDRDVEKDAPESVAFAHALYEAAELHRKKLYDESAAKLEELIETETKSGNLLEEFIVQEETEKAPESDRVKILRHYLNIIRGTEKRSAEMKERQGENPAMMELAAQIKENIRLMIDEWDLDGAENALNQMAKMTPFDPDIEDIRDEIMDRKINYMNYM